MLRGCEKSIMEKQSPGQQSARRKFFNWMMNWYCGKDDSSQVYNVPEVTDIVGLLTSAGFKLRHVDTIAALDQQPVAEKTEDYSCRVVVSCAHSGLRVVLESEGTACHCPPVDRGHFWEVSSTVPTNQNQESKTEVGSSFFPQVQSAIAEVVRSVISSLLCLMAEPAETMRPKSRASHASSYANLLVPESSLTNCNLRYSAPQLYGSQDKLLTDANVMKSPIELSRTSSHSVVGAMGIEQETTKELHAVKKSTPSPKKPYIQTPKGSKFKLPPKSVLSSKAQATSRSATVTPKRLATVTPKRLATVTPKRLATVTPKVQATGTPKVQATGTPKGQQLSNSTTRVPTPRPVLKKGVRTVARFGSGPTATSTRETKRNI